MNSIRQKDKSIFEYLKPYVIEIKVECEIYIARALLGNWVQSPKSVLVLVKYMWATGFHLDYDA